MNENRFWGIIAEGWAGKRPSSDRNAIELAETGVYQQLRALSKDELLGFDLAFRRMMIRLDRAELYRVTGCTDQTFEGVRTRIILLGRAFMEQVLKDPSGLHGIGAERVLIDQMEGILDEKHGVCLRTLPSIASFTNLEGWPDADELQKVRQKVLEERIKRRFEHLERETPYLSVRVEGDRIVFACHDLPSSLASDIMKDLQHHYCHAAAKRRGY